MRIDGQCHCGRVRYVADIAPEQVSICHCTDCQSLTGSAFRVTVMKNSPARFAPAARRDYVHVEMQWRRS